MGKGICMNKLKQMETALSPGGGQQAVDQMDNQTLLLRYKETGDMELKWALVLRYTDLVRRIAIQTCGLFSGFTQLDDVIHEGILVLLSAVDKYDPEKEVKFEAYIAKRLRGMVIDLVRKQDWIPRRVRQKATRLKRAAEELSIELGHTPSDQEMADYLKLSQKDYEELLSETAFSNLMSFEVLLDTYGNVTGKALSGNPPEDAYQQKELHEVVAEIQNLPGLHLAGLTHFPCLLWDEAAGKVLPTPNLHTLIQARDQLAKSGIALEQLNAPSATSCTSLPLLAQYGVTHAEPGWRSGRR